VGEAFLLTTWLLEEEVVAAEVHPYQEEVGVVLEAGLDLLEEEVAGVACLLEHS
jgi:hypothetical protein